MATYWTTFPHRFQLSEYECTWLEAGGCVAVRVARTGDDTQDWYESDVTADTVEEATEIARALIAEYEDSQKEVA